MSLRFHNLRVRTGRSLALWPVLLLLVLLPTAGVLWLTSAAVENTRLAVRQRLTEVYQGHLTLARQRLEDSFKKRAASLEQLERQPPSAALAEAIRAKLADSVILYDGKGRPAYPDPPSFVPGDKEDDAALAAPARLEYVENVPLEAAQAYAAIAQQTKDTIVAARALEAQARCLVRAGRPAATISVLSHALNEPGYRQVRDRQGRLIWADAQLRALQLMGTPAHADFRATAERLSQFLSDYRSPGLQAAQRRFLMKQLQAILPPSIEFPTLDAEELAAEYFETDPARPKGSGLQPTTLAGLWQLALDDGRLVALFRLNSLERHLESLLAEQGLPAGVHISLRPPGDAGAEDAASESLSAGRHLPGWRLVLAVADRSPLDATAQWQVTMYLWIGVLVVAATTILVSLLAGAIGRQLRLTRLKNDLVATVSHELKTPLTSMRVLVDTLLDSQRSDPRQTRDYLQLIAKENVRLSRLIDNFLTFSRMERNKHAFELEETSPAEIAADAVEAVRERLSAPGCQFDVQIAADLPPILADRDALITAVLNLLDNAYKYTDDQKRIVFRAYAENEHVCFEVRDNGIGLSKAASRRVFKRFYQVDRRLSRRGGGCGLGLSIVHFIARQHGGSVRLTSRPGQGSAFTLVLPALHTAPTHHQEAPAT